LEWDPPVIWRMSFTLYFRAVSIWATMAVGPFDPTATLKEPTGFKTSQDLNKLKGP
jgi:hypothetical protein